MTRQHDEYTRPCWSGAELCADGANVWGRGITVDYSKVDQLKMRCDTDPEAKWDRRFDGKDVRHAAGRGGSGRRNGIRQSALHSTKITQDGSLLFLMRLTEFTNKCHFVSPPFYQINHDWTSIFGVSPPFHQNNPRLDAPFLCCLLNSLTNAILLVFHFTKFTTGHRFSV